MDVVAVCIVVLVSALAWPVEIRDRQRWKSLPAGRFREACALLFWPVAAALLVASVMTDSRACQSWAFLATLGYVCVSTNHLWGDQRHSEKRRQAEDMGTL